MESGVSAEVHFAQKLASNEKKIRDRAIKRLNRYLSVRSRLEAGLSEPDLLKIWKGLFYCMWMQDKPLIQEELSQRITNLVQCFPKTEVALKFVKVFLETQSREWNGIDRLRLDKFMMMLRDMIHQTFTLLSKNDWQESDCRTFALSVYEQIMSAHESRLPDGLKLHLADIFVEELKKVSVEKLTSKTMLILLQPFIEFILFTNKKELASRVLSEVIYKVIKAISNSTEVTEENDKYADATDETNQTDEEMEIDVSSHEKGENQGCFRMDKGLLLKLMFEMAGTKEVRAFNRAIIYRLVQKHSKFLDVNTNSVNSSGQAMDADLNEAEKQQEQSFVCDLRFLKDGGKAMGQQLVEQRRKRRKKKKKTAEENTENHITTEIIIPGETVTTEEDKTPKPNKKKKKEKSGNDENTTSGTQITPRETTTEHQDLKLNVKGKAQLQIKDTEKLMNSALDNLESQTFVLGDIKGLGNKQNSKNNQHTQHSVEVVSRKRKYVSEESKDLPPSKKKTKINSSENRSTPINSPQNIKHNMERHQKKKASPESREFVNKSDAEIKANVDTEMQFEEKDRSSNAKPKFRSTSPPKSVPLESTIELVKYPHKLSAMLFVEQDVTKSKGKASSASPLMNKSPTSAAAKVPSSESLDLGVSKDISVECRNQLLPQKHDNECSTPRIKKSHIGWKSRSHSESPEKLNHTALAGTVGDLVVKDPLSIKTEKTPVSSKKKVIFDLRRNKANKFQDYLKSIAKQPDTPYEPTKSPVIGILKSPLNSPALSPSSSEVSCSDSERALQVTSKKALRYRRRASAPGSLIHSPGRRKKIRNLKST